jgi:hypothetical protein
MAISRPFLLAVLGVLLLGATVVAVQSARSGGDSDTAPAVVQTEPAPAQTAQKATPADTVKSAFAFEDLESASFDAELSFGRGDQRVAFDLSGAFERGAANEVPRFEVAGRITAAGDTLSGGFVSLGDRAFLTRGNAGWRVPEEIWGAVVDAAAQGGGSGVPLQLHPETWLRDVKSEGTQTLDGVETEHVSATVDPRAVVNDLTQAARANGAEMPNPRAVTRAVKSAGFDVWVGADDRILRRVSGQLVFAGGGRMELDVRLGDVNEKQNIEAPARVLAGAPGGAFGQLAEGIVAGVSGGETSLKALTSPNPRRAARAVRDHRKVVILFRNPRGLDDRAMLSVMRAVDGRTKALVLTDHVDAVERYGKLVEDVGVSQTPSVVLIDRSGKARLIEGYVDSNTLTQAVADAR